MGRLTARKVETARAGRHQDGRGLFLNVSKTGGKRWILRFQLNGRRRDMGLGSWPEISLADARQMAEEARKLIAKGIDPIEARQQAETQIPIFTQAAAAFIRANRHGWTNYGHRMQWTATLKTYARPVIGDKPVDQITTEDILQILQPIWSGKTETAKRVQGRIENILDFAAARRWRDPVNPARWRGHLDKLLPRPGRVKTVRPQPAMPWQELPGFMAELSRLKGISAQALQMLILTAARTGEIIGAQWHEIDIEAAIWTIPASRMKARKEHRVPLSPAAMKIIEGLPRVKGNDHLFPGKHHGKPLSNIAMLEMMRGLGYGVRGERGPYVPHGFRSTFRDWAGEVSSFPGDVCEMALAHTIKDKAEAAYRRGDLFDKRRNLMNAWANYCLSAGADIVPLKRLG